MSDKGAGDPLFVLAVLILATLSFGAWLVSAGHPVIGSCVLLAAFCWRLGKV